MRFPKTFALSLIASVAILAGCSAGNLSAPPSGSNGVQSSQMKSQARGDVRPVLKSAKAIPLASCPPQYTGGCFYVDASSPVEFEWCFSSSGNCTSGLTGNVTWSVVVLNAEGKVVKKPGTKLEAVWSPNPGNPSTVTIGTSTKKLNTTIKYGVELSGCYTSGCISDFVEYGIAI